MVAEFVEYKFMDDPMIVCPEEFKCCDDVSKTLPEYLPMVVCSRETIIWIMISDEMSNIIHGQKTMTMCLTNTAHGDVSIR